MTAINQRALMGLMIDVLMSTLIDNNLSKLFNSSKQDVLGFDFKLLGDASLT